ncbi:hypothetical protein SAMN05443245_0507 [Paraburkholderia fungorum]|uniref:Uncharacterized protein n=1 Tax=Paraburkholderia fungorum TaxID=134537 RepID=A0A1H0Z8A3_9BURK|nr:hypothetical protein SAMN05443245_0507 [Paraburkholderia fungorum]
MSGAMIVTLATGDLLTEVSADLKHSVNIL